MITIDPAAKSATLSKSSLSRFVNSARRATGLSGEVDILLSTDAELKRLNQTFRGKNKPTDVLSFPTPAEIAQSHAGDLAISVETAARQARAFGHPLSDELRILILHGLLHLNGMDHETDQGEMAAREAELRRQLRLPATLIERAAKPATPKREQRRRA